jgi:hypothetical protein
MRATFSVLAPFGRKGGVQALGERSESPGRIAKNFVFPFQLIDLVLAFLEGGDHVVAPLRVVVAQSSSFSQWPAHP